VPGPKAFGALASLLAAALLIGLLWTSGHYARPRHPQFREAAAMVVRHEPEAPGAMLLAYGAHAYHFDYYLAHLGTSQRIDLAVPAWGDTTEFLRLLDAQHPDSVWLLSARHDPDPQLLAALDSRFERLRHEVLHHTSVRLYARRTAAVQTAPRPAR
jgi:hypothetical protein